MASHSRFVGALRLWMDVDMQKSNACTAKGYYKSANNGERLAESVCIGLFHWNEIEKQKGTKNYASRVIKMHDVHRKLQTGHAIMITEEQTHTVHETHFIQWKESVSIIGRSEKCQRSFQLSPELRFAGTKAGIIPLLRDAVQVNITQLLLNPIVLHRSPKRTIYLIYSGEISMERFPRCYCSFSISELRTLTAARTARRHLSTLSKVLSTHCFPNTFDPLKVKALQLLW